MSDAEIGAAWLKTKQELAALQREKAGLDSELKRFGEALNSIGKIFRDQPDMAWNVDISTLLAEAEQSGVRAKRYNALLSELGEKQSELARFEKAE
jgi:hypothetical protein